MKFNLNQKRDRVRQAYDEVQTEVFKRLKVGGTLKGTYASLTAKKKQFPEAQYQASKAELEHMEQTKKLQSLLETCKKELNDEKSRTKQLEVTLRQNQYELNQRIEEMRELKEQSHKNLEDANTEVGKHPEDLSNREKIDVNNVPSKLDHELPLEGSAILGKWGACLSLKSHTYYEDCYQNASSCCSLSLTCNSLG